MASDQEIRVRLRCLGSAPRERIAEAALIGADVGFGGGFQVTPRQRNQVVAARGAQCSDHFDVVAACTVERFREGVGVGANPKDFLRETLDGLDQARIAAQTEQSLVKMQVGVEYREHVTGVHRGAVLALQFVELGEVARIHGKRKYARGHDFQLLANRIDLRHLPRSEIAHHRAAIGNALNEPLLFQLEQGEANVSSMRVEVLAQVLFDQALARVAPAEDDVLLEARRDDMRDTRLARGRDRFRRLRLRRGTRKSSPALWSGGSADGHREISIFGRGCLESQGLRHAVPANGLTERQIVYNIKNFIVYDGSPRYARSCARLRRQGPSTGGTQ